MSPLIPPLNIHKKQKKNPPRKKKSSKASVRRPPHRPHHCPPECGAPSANVRRLNLAILLGLVVVREELLRVAPVVLLLALVLLVLDHR